MSDDRFYLIEDLESEVSELRNELALVKGELERTIEKLEHLTAEHWRTEDKVNSLSREAAA
jgi:hypothetical protein